MLCRCASPGGESSACIARAWSRVSRVPVGAGAQVPSPCLVATAAQTHLCCQAPTCHTNDAWRPTRAGATADRQQKQLQRGAGISAAHQQRGAGVQQHAGARRPHSVVACCLCHDGLCRYRYGYGYGFIHCSASGFMTPPEGLLAPAPHECICTTCPPHRGAINVVDCTRLITRLVGRALGALASRRWCGAVRTSWWQPCASSRPLPRSIERWL